MIDRIYESFLHTKHGKNAPTEWMGRLEEEGDTTTGAGFPDGEMGRYEPFGINPSTGLQYGCKDTFDTAPLGYQYDSLIMPPPQRLRELPTYAMFEAVHKERVNGSKELFVFLSDGSWAEPDDLASLTHAGLMALPGLAAVTALFVQPEGSVHCDNCVRNFPTISVEADVTPALRERGLTIATASVHALAWDIAERRAMTLADAGVVAPVLRGPRFGDDDIAEGSAASADVSALQRLLGVAEDGVAGVETIAAVKRVQREAGLAEDGVVGPKTKYALRTALHEDGNGEHGRVRPASAGAITWRLAVGTVPGYFEDRSAVAAEIAKAFDVWGAASGLQFEQVTEKGNEQLTMRFANRTRDNTFSFDGPGGCLAAATDKGVTFDSAERWELHTTAEPHPQREALPDEYFFKLLPVAIHEIGHCLGLSHSSDPTDIMSPYYQPDKVRAALVRRVV